MKTTSILLLIWLVVAAPAAVRGQFGCVTNADGASVTITNYDGPGGDVTIPSQISGLPVTTIGASAFWNSTALTNVTIPASVTNLGIYSFGQCFNLTNVFFMGNAPSEDDSFVIVASTNSGGAVWVTFSYIATAYYLPSTIGWDAFSSNANIPAILWNPQIQTNDGNFGARSNQFGFDIAGTANIPFAVEASTNLAGSVWTQLQSLSLTNGLCYFGDSQWTNYPNRFYRICPP